MLNEDLVDDYDVTGADMGLSFSDADICGDANTGSNTDNGSNANTKECEKKVLTAKDKSLKDKAKALHCRPNPKLKLDGLTSEQMFPILTNYLSLRDYSTEDLGYLISIFFEEILQLEERAGKSFNYHNMFIMFRDMVEPINTDLIPNAYEFVNTLGMFENALQAKDYIKDMAQARKNLKKAKRSKDFQEIIFCRKDIDRVNRELLERQKLVFKYSDNEMNRRKVNRVDINVSKTLSLEDIHKRVQEIKNITPNKGDDTK